MNPREAVVAVTYRCNSRCIMCDVWKGQPPNELTPETYVKLPATLREINVSGGEPFLREDLPAVIESIRQACPRARILISTNGFLSNRIERMMSKMPDVAVRISLDGIGEKHDLVRGVNGAFDNATESLERLKRLGVKDIGVGVTTTRLNENEIVKVEKFAKEQQIQFNANVVHSSETLFGDQSEAMPDAAVAARQLALVSQHHLISSHPKNWFRGYYFDGLIDYIQSRPRRIRCKAGDYFFFLDPAGDIYPCNVLALKMGNIVASPSEKVFPARDNIRDRVQQCRRNCWMTCTVAPMVRSNPVKPLIWITREKTRLLLGLGSSRIGTSHHEQR